VIKHPILYNNTVVLVKPTYLFNRLVDCTKSIKLLKIAEIAKGAFKRTWIDSV